MVAGDINADRRGRADEKRMIYGGSIDIGSGKGYTRYCRWTNKGQKKKKTFNKIYYYYAQ